MNKERDQKSAVEMYIETVVEMTAESENYSVIEKTDEGYSQGFVDGDIDFEDDYRLFDSWSVASYLENSGPKRLYLDAKEEDGRYLIRTHEDYEDKF